MLFKIKWISFCSGGTAYTYDHLRQMLEETISMSHQAVASSPLRSRDAQPAVAAQSKQSLASHHSTTSSAPTNTYTV